MKILKSKWFNKWAKKSKISDQILTNAILGIDETSAIKLGAGLYKIRVARPNEGKRGGFRTIVEIKMTKEKRNPKIKEAVGSLAQDLIDSGLGSPFTEKELNYYGVKIPMIKTITPRKIKSIRQKAKLSQSVFAKLLNVSPASIKQWEQGTRNPSGSTKVLLDLLDKEPHLLDYRILRTKRNTAA